jgi:hypothetical protein
MPRTLHQLTVFVSGPSGIEAEKAALRKVAEEISRRMEKTHGVTLRVVSWPEDFRPGLNCDPQSEINRQLGSDWDIYVGVLGSRFGNATPRGASGTQEEFESALARFQQDSTSVRLLFYFKRSNEDPFLLDIDQLQQVRTFRDSLGGRGVLYWDFADTHEFTQRVREHVDSLSIDEWRDGAWAAVQVEPSAIHLDRRSNEATEEASATVSGSLADGDPEDIELGLLEYVAAFNEAVESISEIMAALGAATERVGAKMSSRSAETDELRADFEQHKNVGGSRAQQQLIIKSRAIVDQAAEDLDEFVRAMAPRVAEYTTQNRALFESYRRAFAEPNEFGERDTRDDRRALARLIVSTTESREKVMGFQASVAGLPGLTGKFKRSRRRASAVIGELIAEMSFAVDEASAVLQEMGGEPDNPA